MEDYMEEMQENNDPLISKAERRLLGILAHSVANHFYYVSKQPGGLVFSYMFGPRLFVTCREFEDFDELPALIPPRKHL